VERLKVGLVTIIRFLRRKWTSIAFLISAGILISLGFYIQHHPDWTLNSDIRAYNLGSFYYTVPPGSLPAIPSEGRPEEWPIERAAAYWSKAASITRDNYLKSLALYNVGALIARESYASSLSSGTAQVEMAMGIANLKEALRIDPNNDDAQYDLELLEKMAKIQSLEEGAPGEGFSSGAIEEGF
jgi:hypothetical protein